MMLLALWLTTIVVGPLLLGWARRPHIQAATLAIASCAVFAVYSALQPPDRHYLDGIVFWSLLGVVVNTALAVGSWAAGRAARSLLDRRAQ
ncbi:hypothetical protein [Bosea sp. BIWAKO-01]|uniref:hypothetical protein n=1 Tax=Bosea sp. BIWAKO-01 TaxID=506668 RepID=UPI00114CE774|nr:hypothetical protein [Bosea sp. BIWAKO-01]